MQKFLVFSIYNALVPFLLLLGFPSWVLKMRSRGGFGTGLLERLGLFDRSVFEERQGGIYVHAVSVGEVMIALKMIKKWSEQDPDVHFVLVPTTATGHAVARKHASDRIRVIYSPVDFYFIVDRVLERLQPSELILVEAEMWPNLLLACEQRNIKVSLVNTRLSSRSEGRFHKLIWFARPVFQMVSKFYVQESVDVDRWLKLGIAEEKIEHTGSIKFDPAGGSSPTRRPEFAEMIESLSSGQKIVMAMSTFPGEEAALANELKALEGVFLVFVPRHMERRDEVVSDLVACGLNPVLRSDMQVRESSAPKCLVVDSTGELRDWTAHADVAIIGKSWLAKGGQNPAEAIAAGVPVITGKEMGNFEPLVGVLVENGGIFKLDSIADLGGIVDLLISDDKKVAKVVKAANQVLAAHEGATQRTIDALAG